MGKYATLKNEFEFLAKLYGFEISLKQKRGAYYYIVWTNPNKNIMILYDEQVEVPISIRVYDSDSFSFDAIEYKNEFDQQRGSPKKKIRRAAEWLNTAIKNKLISI